MTIFYELRKLSATLVFDLTDAFATTRGTRGPFPRPFEPIRFFATAEGTGLSRKEFDPPLQLDVRRNGNGYHVFHNGIKQPDGIVLKKALATGQYDFRVESNFYQRAELTAITIPEAKVPETISLFPAYNYPFPLELKPTGGRGFALLRGSLHTRDGQPIADATVSALGANNPYTTDKTGQWVLIFPDSFFPSPLTSAMVTVDVTPVVGPVVNVANVTVDKGGERALGETSLRGWVVAHGIGVGGATVEVQGRPGLTTTAKDGSWSYYFGLDFPASISVDVTAHLPDGSTLTQTNQQVQLRATAIVPPFEFP